MGVGTSFLLMAVGAILCFAVSLSTHGIDLQTVGVIFMVVGGVGLVMLPFSIAMAADRQGGRRADRRPSADPRNRARASGALAPRCNPRQHERQSLPGNDHCGPQPTVGIGPADWPT